MEKLPKYLKDSWKLKVRILQLWKQPFQIDMILMDEKVAIKKIMIPNFEMLLQEGSIIILSKFSIAENNEMLLVMLLMWRYTCVYSKWKREQADFFAVRECRDNYAQEFATSVSTGNIEGFVIIIIQFGKVRFWNGNPTVQNALFGTRLFLNEDIEEINKFKRSLIVKKGVSTHSQMTTHLASQTVYTLRDEFLTKYPRKYVDDIPDGTEKLVCVLLGTIKDIQEEYGWYYIAFRKYNKNVVSKSESLKDIDVTDNEGGDKINVRVQDGTGTISLVLFDHEDGDVNSFPKDFDKLINKKFIFKIEVSKFNYENGYDVYTISKLCDDAEIMDAMIKRDATDKVICDLFQGDVVSCISDSLAATDIDSNSATSPATKGLRNTFDKDILGSIAPSWSMMHRVTKSAISMMNSMTRAKHVSNGIIDVSTFSIIKDYFDNGDPTFICRRCGAMLWHAETLRGNQNGNKSAYSLCCGKGKVQLSKCPDPPQLLSNLYQNKHPNSKNFINNIRAYNMMFSFTSMRGKVDSSVNKGRGPYLYRLQGQNYHLMGSLLPIAGSTPKFSQLYIYDTENEVANRKNTIRSGCDQTVISYRMARDRFIENNQQNVKLKLIGRREKDGRTYNLPSASEVAGIVIDDIDASFDKRDIVVETQSVIYTVEFQKCGLPHAHICIFLDAKDKFPSVGDIDRVICAKIPDK
ncbi:replication protein A 70 kDa DNA-binding subunit C-like protein [Tanacetum coccineum]